jgi:hypothetical protein
MRAHEEDVTVGDDGVVKVDDLPVKAGDRVRVIVLMPEGSSASNDRYPLRGKGPYRFDRPTDPVAARGLGIYPHVKVIP